MLAWSAVVVGAVSLALWGGSALARTDAAAAAAPLRVVTEEFPPYNYTQNGHITGFSSDVVRAVLAQAGLQGAIQSLPWARAYQIARSEPGVLIYSIGRNAQRESLFKWVGVIAPTHYYLYSMAARPVRLDSLEQARTLQVATVNEDVGEQYLVAKGFVIGRNLQSSNRYELNYEKLKLGRVDLWIIPELVAFHLVRQAGDDPARTLAPSLALPDLGSDGYYMAFGDKTPQALVERLRKALATIKANGTYDALRRKWL